MSTLESIRDKALGTIQNYLDSQQSQQQSQQ